MTKDTYDIYKMIVDQEEDPRKMENIMGTKDIKFYEKPEHPYGIIEDEDARDFFIKNDTSGNILWLVFYRFIGTMKLILEANYIPITYEEAEDFERCGLSFDNACKEFKKGADPVTATRKDAIYKKEAVPVYFGKTVKEWYKNTYKFEKPEYNTEDCRNTYDSILAKCFKNRKVYSIQNSLYNILHKLKYIMPNFNLTPDHLSLLVCKDWRTAKRYITEYINKAYVIGNIGFFQSELRPVHSRQSELSSYFATESMTSEEVYFRNIKLISDNILTNRFASKTFYNPEIGEFVDIREYRDQIYEKNHNLFFDS